MTDDMRDIHPDYETNETETEQMTTAAPDTLPDTAAPTSRSSSEKRQRMMAHADYKEGSVHQRTAHIWATVEVREAIDAQAAIIAAGTAETVAATVAQTAAIVEQTAAVVAGTAAVALQTEAIASQTAAIDAQTTVIEWNGRVAEAQVAELRSQSQMQYYAIRHLMPEAVAAQMRAALGISDGAAVEAPAAPIPIGLHRVPAPAVPELDEVDFS